MYYKHRVEICIYFTNALSVGIVCKINTNIKMTFIIYKLREINTINDSNFMIVFVRINYRNYP